MRRLALICAVLASSTALWGRSSTETAARRAVWPADEWQASTPEEQGIDSRRLAATLDSIRAAGDQIHSLTVVRNGYLVLDVAFYPYETGGLHDLASSTKSVTSALIGLAIEKGLIRSVRQPMLELFPGSGPQPGKQDIRVEHLLTMMSGMNCGVLPGEVEWMAMQQSPNWVQFALNLEMAQPPGAGFAYCSPGVHLLSAMIQEASGMKTLDFARQNLLDPLGIGEVIWPADPQGVTFGPGELRMRPLDMARFGLLYLRRGEWNGARLLSEDWIAESSRQHYRFPEAPGEGYGYLWWIFPELYHASGRGGQTIAICPDKQMVIVTTGAGYRHRQIVFDQILPAAIADEPLPENREAFDALQSRIEAARTPPAPGPVPPLPPTAARISGKVYRIGPNWVGLQTLRLTFQDGQARLELAIGPEQLNLAVGLDNVYRISPGRFGLPAACRGAWRRDGVFAIEFNEIGNNALWRGELTFSGDRLALQMVDNTGLPEVRAEGRADP